MEDFLCLARQRSFSRAAEERCVTQSAFSRRIRSLENWLGAPLIDRSLYPVGLTATGEDFLHTAADIARKIHEAQANAEQERQKTVRTITLAAPHSLSLNFFAQWAAAIEKRIGGLEIHLITDNHYNAAQSLREGACDFLLCFTCPQIMTMPQGLFESRVLGEEQLIPVTAPVKGARRPRFQLPGDKTKPLPYLSYGLHVFLGKVVRLILERQPCYLEVRYENAFAESLKSMALCGRGLAWLPENMVREDIAAARLCRAGGECWNNELNICLVRRHEETTPLCAQFWAAAGSES